MSNTITIKKGELPQYSDAYGKVSTAHIVDSDLAMAKIVAEANGTDVAEAMRDLKERVSKVTYAAGKVYNRIVSAIHAANKKYDSMMNRYSDPEYNEYQEKRVELCKMHAEKDDNDNPKLIDAPTDDEPDRRIYVIANDQKEAFGKETEALKIENKGAIDRFEANTVAANAIKEEEVEIKVHVIPWTYRPNAVSGAYVALVVDMFSGAPTFDELLEDVDEDEDENKGLQVLEHSV